MEHGRTLERLDVFKTKQQQQKMMQKQEQQQIRDLHKESLSQILSLEERIRQLELQELKENPVTTTTAKTAMNMMPTTTAKTTMKPMTTGQKSLTDQQKSGKESKTLKNAREATRKGEETQVKFPIPFRPFYMRALKPSPFLCAGLKNECVRPSFRPLPRPSDFFYFERRK